MAGLIPLGGLTAASDVTNAANINSPGKASRAAVEAVAVQKLSDVDVIADAAQQAVSDRFDAAMLSTLIPDGVSINTLLTPVRKLRINPNGVTKALGYPEDGWAGHIDVKSSGGYVQQTATGLTLAAPEVGSAVGGNQFIRTYYGGEWSKWTRVALQGTPHGADLTGAGSPEGVVTAERGVTYADTAAMAAGNADYRWLKTSGGNTGWMKLGSIFAADKARLNASAPLDASRQMGAALGLIGVENILTNGVFDQGTTGWAGGNGTVSVLDGVATVTGSGSTSSFGVRADVANIFKANAGEVLYMATVARVIGTGATALALMLESSAGSYRVNRTVHSDPGAGTWATLSGRYQVTAPWSGIALDLRPMSYWGSPANAAGRTMQVNRVLAVNLTKIFGPGKEPSLEEMDDWLAGLPRRSLAPVAWWPAPQVTPPAPPIIESSLRRFFQRGLLGVILRFDDGYKNIRTLAAPYMAERGMVGYMAACPGIPGHQFIAGEVMANSELVELHYMGWEIGNHVADHSTIASPNFYEQVDLGSRLIVDAGLPYPHTMTYPTGARSAESDREMYYRFHQAQLTYEPNTTATKFDQPVFHTGWVIFDGLATPQRRAEQVARAKRYVLGSIRAGLVPILAFHNVLPVGEDPTIGTQLQWEVFKEIIDWLYLEGVPTILPRDLPTHNMLVDGGFNEYPVAGFDASAYPWGAAAATGVWGRVTTGQHSGLGAIRVQSSGPVSGSVSQGIAVEPGRTYRVRMLTDVSSITAGSINVRIRPRLMYGDQVGPDLHPIQRDTATAGYQDLTGTFTVPDGVNNASVFVRADGFTGTAHVDNVAIFPVELFDPVA